MAYATTIAAQTIPLVGDAVPVIPGIIKSAFNQTIIPGIRKPKQSAFVTLPVLNPAANVPQPQPSTLVKRAFNNDIPDTSTPAKWDGCYYNVDKVGKFTSRMHVAASDWSSSNFDSKTPHGRFFNKVSKLYGAGLYDASRAVIGSLGNLQLQQWPSPAIPCTECSPGQSWTVWPSAAITTNWSDILYGSVRTVARGDINPGGIYGFFFVGNDDPNGETDIEIRTTYPKVLNIVNQDSRGHVFGPQPWYIDTTDNTDPNTFTDFYDSFHEYRLDWTPNGTSFYIDGIFLETFTGLIPTQPGRWWWNSYSNNHGKSNGWSQGPITKNNSLYIQSIDLYVNRTSVTRVGGCGLYVP